MGQKKSGSRRLSGALALLDISTEQIAEEADCSPSLVRKALSGQRAGRGVVGARVLEIARRELEAGLAILPGRVSELLAGLER